MYDATIMTIVMDADLSQQQIVSINRVRLFLHAIFLSDIVTANGRRIDRRLLASTAIPLRSTYLFPREQPTAADWKIWYDFWQGYTYDGLILWKPLGKWVYPTHNQWTWFYDDIDDLLQGVTNDGVNYYLRCSTRRAVTRLNVKYELSWSDIGKELCQ